jgi:hypothetical protein
MRGLSETPVDVAAVALLHLEELHELVDQEPGPEERLEEPEETAEETRGRLDVVDRGPEEAS